VESEFSYRSDYVDESMSFTFYLTENSQILLRVFTNEISPQSSLKLFNEYNDEIIFDLKHNQLNQIIMKDIPSGAYRLSVEYRYGDFEFEIYTEKK